MDLITAPVDFAWNAVLTAAIAAAHEPLAIAGLALAAAGALGLRALRARRR